MSRTTLARLLAATVALVSVSLLFWPSAGPERASATTTTRPIMSSVPWVDRTTPVGDEFEPSDLERRVALLAEWVEENRGLDFVTPPELEFMDQEAVLSLVDSIYSRFDVPDFEMARSLFGSPDASGDIYWSVLLIHAPLVIQSEAGQGVASEALIPMLVAELTNQHHGYRDDAMRLIWDDLVGDQYEALVGLVVGDASFVTGGYGFHLATGGEWSPAGGCMAVGIAAFQAVVVAGAAYVCRLYEQGGWAAVDAAYENPPQSTAELLGIACEVADTPLTPMPRRPLLFMADRGPIWLTSVLAESHGDISSISGWCRGVQRVVGTDAARIQIMDIWLATPADAEIVEIEIIDHLLMMENPDLKALVVRDGSWVGLASTRSGVDLCAELPSWCDR